MKITRHEYDILANRVACKYGFPCIENIDVDVEKIIKGNRSDYVDCDRTDRRAGCVFALPSPFAPLCGCPVKVYCKKNPMV